MKITFITLSGRHKDRFFYREVNYAGKLLNTPNLNRRNNIQTQNFDLKCTICSKTLVTLWKIVAQKIF